MDAEKKYSAKQPLYYQLATLLKSMIVSGDFPVGYKFQPEDKMALEYKVSRETLRQTLDKLAREGYIVRLKSKGTFVINNFKLRRAVGVVLHDSWTNGMPDGIARTFAGIIQRASASDCEIRAYSMKDLDNLLEEWFTGNNDLLGLIFLRYRDFFKPYLERLDKASFPYILEGVAIPGYHCVDIDNAQAMKTVVDYLFSLGHRNIGIATTEPLSYPDSEHLMQREKSAQNFLKQKSCRTRKEWNIRLPGRNTDVNNRILKDFFESAVEKPTAFICTTDLTAVQLINTAEQCGIRVPENLSVTGFDNLPEIRFYKPGLTTFHQDSNLLGAECVKRLCELADDFKNKKEQLILRPDFIIRESCKINK